MGEEYKFLNLRKSHTDADTSGASDSDVTKLDSCRSSPRVRARQGSMCCRKYVAYKKLDI